MIREDFTVERKFEPALENGRIQIYKGNKKILVRKEYGIIKE